MKIYKNSGEIPFKIKDAHKYVSMDKEIEERADYLQQLLAIVKRFPDAEIGYSEYAPEHCPGSFSAFSVVKDPEVKIEIRDTSWYHMDVKFYVEVPYKNDSTVKVYGNPIDIDLWQVPNGLAVIDDPYVIWNNIEAIFDELGFGHKFLKEIYQALLSSVSTHGFTIDKPFSKERALVRVSNKDQLPDYIKNKLPFI